MKNFLVTVLFLALALSWLWFWTVLSKPVSLIGGPSAVRGDTIRVWVNELITSPEEAYYYELADCWNATHPGVKMKMSVMASAGYESKLRVAIASGQPPDVCMGGLETLESLQYSGKYNDLSVAIPEKFFPRERLERMGRVVREATTRDGKPTVFPVWRYCYGGVILANRRMLREAGFDDTKIRLDGWTLDDFREACRKMTRDLDGDGTPDVWGFGAALVHLEHLFRNEFGPGVWGKELTDSFFKWNESANRWEVNPRLQKEQIYQTMLLFRQLFDQDKVWSPKYLGMDWNEILNELIVHQRLGMTFGESPWVVKLRKEIWETEVKQGARQGPPPDLTVVWMPTLRQGDRPVPRAGVTGFSVMKQIPYKGEAHTENAIRVALYLTHPIHLVRSQMRSFRHLPPEPKRFARIFPELIDNNDPWVRFYNETLESDIPLIPKPLSEKTPQAGIYRQMENELDQWFEKRGVEFIQQVIYGKSTPREAAKGFFTELHAIPDKVYSKAKE